MRAISNKLQIIWTGDEECVKNKLINDSDRITIVYFNISFLQEPLSFIGKQLIKKLLEFFDSFKELRKDRFLFVFLSFMVKPEIDTGPIFKLLKRKGSIDRFREFWEKYDFKSHTCFHGKMLEPLKPILFEELHSYIKRYGEELFTEERIFENKIREIYKNAKSEKLSLGILGDNISDLLNATKTS